MRDDLRIPQERIIAGDGRIATMRRAQEPPRLEDRRRTWKDKLPSLEALRALIVNGRLVLPARYFRGYFLDMLA